TGDSWQEWAAMNDEMIDFCDEVYVLGIEGWQESKGIAHEIAYARAQGKAVRLVTPMNGELVIGELVEETE
ncbi:MAG: DUF4406 domain-containing protein, partial [Dehalococcoidia bacterium]|nr:DUF4406 domain-containing protein [Dehalococcoidia bacterium]